MRQLSRVHIPGASAAGPLTPSVPCALSLFRPIVHPDICQVGPAGDRPLYARYVDGHVTDNVPGRVIASSRVRVWVPYPKFPEEPGTHPRFPKEPGGYRARSSRAPGPVSAWCRLREMNIPRKSAGALPERAWCRPVSRLHQ